MKMRVFDLNFIQIQSYDQRKMLAVLLSYFVLLFALQCPMQSYYTFCCEYTAFMFIRKNNPSYRYYAMQNHGHCALYKPGAVQKHLQKKP